MVTADRRVTSSPPRARQPATQAAALTVSQVAVAFNWRIKRLVEVQGLGGRTWGAGLLLGR